MNNSTNDKCTEDNDNELIETLARRLIANQENFSEMWCQSWIDPYLTESVTIDRVLSKREELQRNEHK